MDYDNTYTWIAPEPKKEPVLARLVQKWVSWRNELKGKINCLRGLHGWVEVVMIIDLQKSRWCRRCHKRQYKAGGRWYNE